MLWLSVCLCACSAWHPDTLPTHSSLKKTCMHSRRYRVTAFTETKVRIVACTHTHWIVTILHFSNVYIYIYVYEEVHSIGPEEVKKGSGTFRVFSFLFFFLKPSFPMTLKCYNYGIWMNKELNKYCVCDFAWVHVFLQLYVCYDLGQKRHWWRQIPPPHFDLSPY